MNPRSCVGLSGERLSLLGWRNVTGENPDNQPPKAEQQLFVFTCGSNYGAQDNDLRSAAPRFIFTVEVGVIADIGTASVIGKLFTRSREANIVDDAP